MTTNTVLAIEFADRWHDFWRGDIGEWILDRGPADRAAGRSARCWRPGSSAGAPDEITRRIDAEYQESDQLVRTESAKHRQAVASVISWVSIAVLFVVVAVEITDILAIPVGSLVAPPPCSAPRSASARSASCRTCSPASSSSPRSSTASVTWCADGGWHRRDPPRARSRTSRCASPSCAPAEGEVFTIPNGQIVKTLNLSKDWARAVVDIPVPTSAPTSTRSTMCCTRSARRRWRIQQLRELLLDAPQLMGVESIELDTVNLRMVARTLPGKQFEVGRRLRVLVIRGADAARASSRPPSNSPIVDTIPHSAETSAAAEPQDEDDREHWNCAEPTMTSRPRLAEVPIGGRIRTSTAGAHRRVRRVVVGAPDLPAGACRTRAPAPAGRAARVRARPRLHLGAAHHRCGGPRSRRPRPPPRPRRRPRPTTTTPGPDDTDE